jgi:uncharacterized protein YjbI with pentapeptide repeats
MLVLAGYSFFCILMLSQPDVALLSSDAEINVPFANTDISFVAFLITGPLVLAGMTAYLHIFIGQWLTFGGRRVPEALPFLFNMDSWLARIVTEYVFYWLVPSVLVVFTWKALPRPEAPLLVAATAAVLVIMLSVRIIRLQREWHRTPVAILSALTLAVVIGVPFVISQKDLRERLVWRPLKLQDAELAGRDLRGFNLRGADLREADLTGARLDEADFRDADLQNAVLDKAKLRKADLRRSNLTAASLIETDMAEADLRDAKLSIDRFQPMSLKGARLTDLDLKGWVYADLDLTLADLAGADLSRADLRGTKLLGANLEGAILDQAKLARADLTDGQLQGTRAQEASFIAAQLTGADLSGAFLMSAKFNGADLSGAKLMGANLRFAQLPGSSLEKANLRGAALSSADLRGADFHLAKMEGASLRYAKAQGARFTLAHLEGVDLANADLRGANFSYTLLVLADLRGTTVERLPEAEASAISKTIPWTDLRPDRKIALGKYFRFLNDQHVPPIMGNAVLSMTEPNGHYRTWSLPPEKDQYYAILAACLSAVACKGPYEADAIVKRVVGDWVQAHEGDLRPRLAQALMDKSCEVLDQMRPQFTDKLEALLADLPVESRQVIDINDAFTIAGEPDRVPAAGPCIATK